MFSAFWPLLWTYPSLSLNRILYYHLSLPCASFSSALLLVGLSLIALCTSSSLRRLSFLLSIFSKTFWKKIYTTSHSFLATCFESYISNGTFFFTVINSPWLFQSADTCFYKTPVCLCGVVLVVRLCGGSDLLVCRTESSHWIPPDHSTLTHFLKASIKCHWLIS